MVLTLVLATQILVIAHRAEHEHHGENSIPAIQSAIQLGVDYVELDVRTTQDGKLVLMHDKTVDRTTGGKGAVNDLTLDQIRHLRLRDYDDQVPTFEEAMETARGKVNIYLDWKDASPKAIFDALSAHGMLDRVVVYGENRELQELEKLAPGIRVMPEADSQTHLDEAERMLKPTVVAFDQGDFKPALISQALSMRADIFVDRLWDQDTESFWQDAIDKGVKGIQTNHPAELLDFLRTRKLHP
jgi:glycerophosphoryl diester phosphodiesterase